MEESHTRKRNLPQSAQTAPPFRIYEEVYIISKFRYYTPKFVDPISISIRAAILCDMVYAGIIGIENGIVSCKGAVHNDNILEDVFLLIRNESCNLETLLTSLNGESFIKNRHMHVKKVRERIGKKLEDMGILSYENKGVFFKGKVRVSIQAKKEVSDDVFSLLEGDYDIRKVAVLGCIMYCDALESLFISLPLKRLVYMKERANNLKKKFMTESTSDDSVERGILSILRYLHKL